MKKRFKLGRPARFLSRLGIASVGLALTCGQASATLLINGTDVGTLE